MLSGLHVYYKQIRNVESENVSVWFVYQLNEGHAHTGK